MVYRTDIRELIEFEVVGAEEEDDTYDKVIQDVVLREVQDQSLIFDLTFRTPSDISRFITNPDTLQINFIVRQLIIDAETFEPLSED